MKFSYDDYIKYFCNDGFLLPELKAELPLYRYRGNLEHIVDEIENDHVYMAPLHELNDPFDSSCAMSFEEMCQVTKPLMCFYVESYFLNGKPWPEELDEYVSSLPNESITLIRFAEIVSEFAKRYGLNVKPLTICELYYKYSFYNLPQRRITGKVVSFAETWESIPMWSYYSDSHKGVCMKYEFDLLRKEKDTYKTICASLKKVWYSEQRFLDCQGTFTPFIKSLQWAHEQEWRLFREYNKDKYLYIPCLTEIYMGINCDPDTRKSVGDAVKKNGRDIKLFIIKPKPNVYGFQRVPLHMN